MARAQGGGYPWEALTGGDPEKLLGAGNILYLEPGGGFTRGARCKDSLGCTLNGCALYLVFTMSIKIEGKVQPLPPAHPGARDWHALGSSEKGCFSRDWGVAGRGRGTVS